MEEEEGGVDVVEEADEEDAVEEVEEVAAVAETRTHGFNRVELITIIYTRFLYLFIYPDLFPPAFLFPWPWYYF